MKYQASESEMEVLKVVWGQEKATSKSIIEALSPSQDWSSTTIKTMLSRLVQKGILKVETQGRRFTYIATINESDVMYQRVDTLAESVCPTNIGSIITYLIENYDLSLEDESKINQAMNSKKFLQEIECNCVMKHHLNCGCQNMECSCHK